MGPWSKLPADLLKVIEDHLVLYIDKVRIRAACVAWNSYLPKLPNHQVKQLPWLLHPLGNNMEASHGLFNPIDEKVYEIYLPEAQGKVFKGSSHGWLVTAEDTHSSCPTHMYLINPMTRARITLPPRTEFADVLEYRPNEVDEEFIVRITSNDVPYVPDLFYDSEAEEDINIDEVSLSLYDVSLGLRMKVVLSSAPCDKCVVVAIYSQARQLAWCRCNDKKWTHIYAGITGIIDISFHKGKLHALTDTGEIFVFENIGSDINTKMTKIASGVPIPRGRDGYLAECSDGSLIVANRLFDYDSEPIRTVGFKVYKLDQLNSSWIEVKDIDDDILFLGFNSARSISAHDLAGYKGNRIYFSDSNRNVFSGVEKNENSDSDIGVFNLESGTLESLRGMRQPIWPRPIWVNVG